MKTRDFVVSILPEEFRVLHSISKKRLLSRIFQNEVKHEVRAQYSRFIRGEEDKLAHKLMCYGNKGRWARAQLERFETAIYDDKGVPNSSIGNWISVEIECIFPEESVIKAFAKFCRNNGYIKFVTVKNDGSIHVQGEDDNRCGECSDCEDGNTCENGSGTSEVGKEIVVSFELGKYEMLQAICDFLNEHDVTVNKTCGLHVHFDCRGMTSRKVTFLAKRLALCVPALKLMLPKSRRDNSYCLKDVNNHKDSNRYAFVNVHSFKKHETLEVRGHSGTIDADDKASLFISYVKNIDSFMIATTSEIIQGVCKAMNWKYEMPESINDNVHALFNGNDIVEHSTFEPIGSYRSTMTSTEQMALTGAYESPYGYKSNGRWNEYYADAEESPAYRDLVEVDEYMEKNKSINIGTIDDVADNVLSYSAKDLIKKFGNSGRKN